MQASSEPGRAPEREGAIARSATASLRKAEIGFESQKDREAEQTRKQEQPEASTRLANAKAAA